MLAKPLNITLIFILSMINFTIMLLPFLFILSPALFLSQDLLALYWYEIIMLIAFATSFLMIFYIVTDSIFGFTVKRLTKKNQPYEKLTSLTAFRDFDLAFKETKRRFGQEKVRLYIDQRYEAVNAFAVGSFFRKRIVITMGLLQKIYENSRDDAQYIDAVKGIMGHEMSHLTNKDFLPALLLSANRAASRHIFLIIRIFFIVFIKLFSLIPFIGSTISYLLVKVHNFVFNIINFFLKLVIMPIHNIIAKKFSRSIEYRCDKESAYAFGGYRITTALSMLGKGSYVTIFSTHPKNKSRIAKVKYVKTKIGIVKPSIISRLTNFASIFFMILACYFFWVGADFKNIDKNFKLQVSKPIEKKIENNINKLKKEINILYLKLKN